MYFEEGCAEEADIDDFTADAVHLRPNRRREDGDFSPIKMNQPKKARMESAKTTVKLVVVRPTMVGIWRGAPKTTSRIRYVG